MCTCVHVSVEAREGVELQVSGSDQIWVLETKCGPSTEAVHALKHAVALNAESYRNSLILFY